MVIRKSTGSRTHKQRSCFVCSQLFRRSGGTSTVCCGRKCGVVYRLRNRPAKAVEPEPIRPTPCRQLPAARKPRPCRVCGVAFDGHGNARMCSPKCRRSKQRLTHRGRNKHTSRARRLGLPRDYSINSGLVFERDKWRCQLCGGPVRRSAATSHPLAPELDHIVPLSHPASPGHVWSNVQCAHRKCNGIKHSRIVGQLRIF
jgi:5-methylcytosine-specific restriction endonuclease McrA